MPLLRRRRGAGAAAQEKPTMGSYDTLVAVMHYPIAITAWYTLRVQRLPWFRVSRMK